MSVHPGTGAPSASSGSNESKRPHIEPIRLPTPDEIRVQDVWNSCAVHSVVSGVMGGGLGLAMGLFQGALDNPIMQDAMTGRQQFIYTAKQMGRRSWGSCKIRAKHDINNTAVAGCVTGGAMSAMGGPKSACIGCAGFATLSVLLEKFLDRHDD